MLVQNSDQNIAHSPVIGLRFFIQRAGFFIFPRERFRLHSLPALRIPDQVHQKVRIRVQFRDPAVNIPFFPGLPAVFRFLLPSVHRGSVEFLQRLSCPGFVNGVQSIHDRVHTQSRRLTLQLLQDLTVLISLSKKPAEHAQQHAGSRGNKVEGTLISGLDQIAGLRFPGPQFAAAECPHCFPVRAASRVHVVIKILQGDQVLLPSLPG